MDSHLTSALHRRLRDSEPYRALAGTLRDTFSAVDVQRLPLPAAAWAGELLGRDLDRPLLVVVPREADALAWLEAARLFAADVSAEAGKGADGGTAVYFPAPSLSPYQEADTSLPVRAQEAVALERILGGGVRTVVCTPRALFRRLPAARELRSAAVDLVVDEELPIELLSEHLLRYGYQRTDLVTEVGEFAVRGGVFDLFPPGQELPVRLDLFGDTIESIRSFDPDSQRSEDRLTAVRAVPLALQPVDHDAARRLRVELARRQGPEVSPEAAARLRDLEERGRFPGWENYLPVLHGDTGTEASVSLPSLLGTALTVLVEPGALVQEADHHRDTLVEEYETRLREHRLAAAPEELEFSLDAVLDVLSRARLRLQPLIGGGQLSAAGAGAAGGGAAEAVEVDFGAMLTDSFHGQLPRFATDVRTAGERGERAVVVVTPEHRPRLTELLEGRELSVGSDGLQLVEGELQRGFRLPAVGVSFYGESQLFPRVAPAIRRRSKVRYGPFISSLRDLKVGDHVVHVDHGIGRFAALRAIRPEGSDGGPLPPSLQGLKSEAEAVEVMEIVYNSGRTLLLPLSRLDQVQKYSGIEGSAPRLDSLGGTSWNKTKSKVRKSLRQMAGQLLKLYAERQLAEAPVMAQESDLQRQFGAAFAYDETGDQLEAIREIGEDLQRKRPMDRLLCGDVGYGKTEVAMRAAFKVVDSGFQVAVLAPTTILADQHLETFRKRFAGFPVTIDMVSRFRSNAEMKVIADKVAAGTIDVLVGTHRLLSKDLEFKKLGLLIVDEEQRFGVAQKEKLKQLKKDVHVLAMSATPVPRTLQLSLAGVRDLSVIETPPKDRMAVETTILPFTPELVREAVEFELERGGQVYYVYNRVESIENMLTWLKEIVPQARITVGHGQLDERELARRMHAFTDHQYDILLASTIIENGIDIPNVNTMIVHQAERFGLSQLYQLRGRVGRSNQLAYCYLLVAQDKILTELARKRLAAIREFTDLGAGFRIAARDLEIRGAGNLLGSEQSGHIAAVGIETYLKMLEDAVRELRGEAVSEAPSTTMDLPVPMSIPEEYVQDANLRMEVYRKVAAGESSEADLLAELTDRFGAPPPSVHTLLKAAEVKRRAEVLRVQALSVQKGTLTLRLRQDTRVDLESLIALVSQHKGASFSPSGALSLPAAAGAEVLPQILGLFDELDTGEVESQQAKAMEVAS